MEYPSKVDYTRGMLDQSPQPKRSSITNNQPRDVFIGRHSEMAALTKALDDVLTGQGRLVMLVGEPGIGKTRTSQELAAYADHRGAQVLWGRCYEEGGAPSYWPWVQAIRSYVQSCDPQRLRLEMGPGAAVIAEIVPEVRQQLPDLERAAGLEPEQARFRLFDSITTFLKNMAASKPLLLVLDDLHWADKPSLLLLEFLTRELAGSHILVLGCYRDMELSRQHPLAETLGQLAREPVFQRELLRGMTQDEAQSLIETAAGAGPPEHLWKQFIETPKATPFS